MPDNRVVIQYQQTVDRAPGQRRHHIGETYVVTDAATAEATHPKAKITKYADGRKFVRTQDETLNPPEKPKTGAGSGKSASTSSKPSSATTSAQGAKQG